MLSSQATRLSAALARAGSPGLQGLQVLVIPGQQAISNCNYPALAIRWPCKQHVATAAVALYYVVQAGARVAGEAVLTQLRRIIDPDFGEDIVSCGFVKDMNIDAATGAVSFTLELTTPACPVKDQFKREAIQYVQV